MSDEDEYSFACQRAELLGQPTPSKDEWELTRKNNSDTTNDEDLEDAVAQNLDDDDESMKRVGGGLDELNSILSTTQKKINRFKTVCGSLGSLLKVKVTGSKHNTPNHKTTSNDNDKIIDQVNDELKENEDEIMTIESDDKNNIITTTAKDENDTVSNKKININEKLGSHLDKLDSLINKAENAQYSMQHQTKQMRKILRK